MAKWWALLTAALLWTCLFSAQTFADPDGQVQGPTPPEAAATSGTSEVTGIPEVPGVPGIPGVDAFYGLKAHRLVEEWVSRGGVPGERAEALRVTGLLGLRVTLRLDGVTVGTGTALRPNLPAWLGEQIAAGTTDRSEPDRPGTQPLRRDVVDLIGLLEAATSEALADVAARLRDRQFDAAVRAARMSQALETDALGLQEVGPTLRVDLQLAFDTQPIIIAPDAPDAAVYSRFAPGDHGLLALALDHRQPTIIWPATALGQNASPRRQILELLSGSGLKITDTARLGRPGGPDLYRFSVIHMVRTRSDQPTLQLIRGSRLMPERFVSQRTVEGLIDRIASHLAGRLIGGGRIRGTYHPASGRYDPELADPMQASLTAFALASYAIQQRQRNLLAASAEDLQVALVNVMERTVGQLLAADAPPDASRVVATGFALLALLQLPEDAYDTALRDRVAGLLLRHVDSAGAVLQDPTNAETKLAPAGAAVVTAALTALFERTGNPEVGDKAGLTLEALLENSPGQLDLNTLPWLARMYVRSAALLQREGHLDAALRDQLAQSLGRYLDPIAERQIVSRPALGPADVMGGIQLVPQPDGSPPNPAWQTAQVLLYLAAIAREPTIVPPVERAGVLITAAGAARFMAQLMIDEPSGYAMRSPAEAVGGIKLALYDNTLELPPSAITLLALLELRQTFAALTPADSETDSPGETELQPISEP